MAGRQADVVVLRGEERAFLEVQARRHKAPRSLSERCRMVLLCAEGLHSKEVAGRLGVHEHTVGKWRRRFAKDGLEGLTDEYRAGRPRTVSDAQVAEVIERTLATTPKDATHWSIRSMAAASGLSHTTIRRIWTAFGLQPHRSETFKLSSDPLMRDYRSVTPGVSKRHNANPRHDDENVVARGRQFSYAKLDCCHAWIKPHSLPISLRQGRSLVLWSQAQRTPDSNYLLSFDMIASFVSPTGTLPTLHADWRDEPSCGVARAIDYTMNNGWFTRPP